MKTVLLTFDLEEFDVPLEYGADLPFDEQIAISGKGTLKLLAMLRRHGISATFFCTANYADNAPEIMKEIVSAGHEIASHSYYHSKFDTPDLLRSRQRLENITGKQVHGFRMPRMMPVDNAALVEAGYTYNSSINPTYIPGRYNNLGMPRTLFRTGALIQLPSSVTPLVRFPLFWLSFHKLPLSLYKMGCAATMNADSYLNLYFHPWEFEDLRVPAYGLPGLIAKNSGEVMSRKFGALLEWMTEKGYSFSTISTFLKARD
jgi:hypothetical protein